MTPEADEFQRRFLIHVVPAGFQRIRQYGFLANCHRADKLEYCRELLINGLLSRIPSFCCLSRIRRAPPGRAPSIRALASLSRTPNAEAGHTAAFVAAGWSGGNVDGVAALARAAQQMKSGTRRIDIETATHAKVPGERWFR
jgi:hypothetical protein